MFSLMRTKVKVYFYHLFILSIVMLLCFFLMYKDIKRIEGNVLNIRSYIKSLEKELINNNNNEPAINNVVLENEHTAEIEGEVLEERLENEEHTAEIEEEVLEEVTLQNDEDENEEHTAEEENIEDLLNEVEQVKNEEEDYSKLTEEQLLEKTNNELKEYLKSVNKSTNGNKRELVTTILN